MRVRTFVCADCKDITSEGRKGRCTECAATLERRRPSKRERGYDLSYEQASRAPEYVNATHCVTCGQPFSVDNPKTKGHSIAIRDGGEGSQIMPECRRCNFGWRRTGS